MGKNGAGSGKASGGRAAKAADSTITKNEKQVFNKFDSVSTEAKINMLREHQGNLLAKHNEDGVADRELWNHALSQGTVLQEGKDYTVSDSGRVSIKSARQQLTTSKLVTQQVNDNPRSNIYKTKDGYYVDTLTVTGRNIGGGYISEVSHKVTKLNWK